MTVLSSGRAAINDFLVQPEQRVMVFSAPGGDKVAVQSSIPENLKKKAVYFLKARQCHEVSSLLDHAGLVDRSLLKRKFLVHRRH